MSSSLPRLAPYARSLTADCQRIQEEQRVRSKIAERERRRELKQRESLRRQVVQMVIDEMAQQERPREIAIQLEQQKKSLAAIGAAHADDRYALQRSSLYRRFYEPTREEREQREENWHRRRSEHRLQRDARLAQIQVCVCALAGLGAAPLPPRRFLSCVHSSPQPFSLTHHTHTFPPRTYRHRPFRAQALEEARSHSLAAASQRRLLEAKGRYGERLAKIASSASAPSLRSLPPT